MDKQMDCSNKAVLLQRRAREQALSVGTDAAAVSAAKPVLFSFALLTPLSAQYRQAAAQTGFSRMGKYTVYVSSVTIFNGIKRKLTG